MAKGQPQVCQTAGQRPRRKLDPENVCGVWLEVEKGTWFLTEDASSFCRLDQAEMHGELRLGTLSGGTNDGKYRPTAKEVFAHISGGDDAQAAAPTS